MKVTRLILLVWLGFVVSSPAVLLTTLRTGVDESSGNSLLANGAADSNWIVTPASGDAGGTTPRAANVYANYGDYAWTAPLSGTQIITRGTDANGASGTYNYNVTFTLNTAVNNSFVLSGQVWADDQVAVYLNGTQIMALSAAIWNMPAVSFSSVDQSLFLNGVNTLTFAVLNSGGGPTGMDALVTISAAVPEAGEWLMILAGLGLITWWRREDLTQFLQRWSGEVRAA